MIFERVFSPKSVIINLESEDKDEVFEEMAQSIFSNHPEVDREEALKALHERESKMSTGILHGIAVPHGNCESVQGCLGAVGISKRGIDYDALDGAPVHLIFLILCGANDNELHLNVLKELAAVLQNPLFVSELMQKSSPQELFDYLCNAEI